MYFIGDCHDVRQVSIKTAIEGIPTNAATQANLRAICGTQCTTYLKLSEWQICALANGQINGPGHGGIIKAAKRQNFGCAIVCIGNIIYQT